MTKIVSPAPVVIFTYNRVDHTKRVLKSLRQNELSAETDVFVYSDGARTVQDRAAVDQVRYLLNEFNGFKSFTLICQDENLGLAKSIIKGVTHVVNEYGRVIVLEDDIVVAPNFLKFMTEGLDRYQYNNRVMHLSSYQLPFDKTSVPDLFFTRHISCWGWATWSRAWSMFEKDPGKLINYFTPQMINDFNVDGSHNYWEQVQSNYYGLLDTWAIFWMASVFMTGGFALHPRDPLSTNIGMDGTGEHKGESAEYDVPLSIAEQWEWPSKIECHDGAVKQLKKYYWKSRPSYVGHLMAVMKFRVKVVLQKLGILTWLRSK